MKKMLSRCQNNIYSNLQSNNKLQKTGLNEEK